MAYINGKEIWFSPHINMTSGDTLKLEEQIADLTAENVELKTQNSTLTAIIKGTVIVENKDSFLNAINNDEVCSVILTNDIDLETESITITKPIIISGYNHKITSTNNGVLFTVKEDANFKLTNTNFECEGMLVEVPASASGNVTIENAAIISNQLVCFGHDTKGSLSIKNVDATTAETAIAAYYDARVNMCVEDSTITTDTYHCILVDTINESREIEIKNSTLIARTEQAVVIQNVTAPVNLNIVNSTISSHSSHALVAKSNTDTVINIENSRISATLIGVYVTTGTLNIKESTINSTGNSTGSYGITVGTVTMCVESSEIKSNTTYAVISTHASRITVYDTKLISDGGYALHTSAKASITLKGYTYLTGVESESRDILYSGSALEFAEDYMGYGFLVKSNNGYSYDFCETLDVAILESNEYGTPIYALTQSAKTTAQNAGYTVTLDSVTGYYVVT